MKLSEWCKKKMEEAKDGEEAYHYHQLMEMWLQREGKMVNGIFVKESDLN